jgi:hypothetical protein
MRGLVLVLLPAVALGNDVVAYTAEIRGEQQVRTVTGASGSSSGILELFPSLGGLAQLSNASFALGYSPQILFNNVTADMAPQILHTGKAAVELRPNKEGRVALAEQASYGTLDVLTLNSTAQAAAPNAPVAPLQPLPTLEPVPYANSTTDGIFDLALGSRVRSTLDVQYALGGGLSSGVSLGGTIPWQHKLQGTYILSTSLSRLDTLSTTALASRTSFSTGQIAQLAQLGELWRRHLDRITDLEVGVGGALANVWMGVAKGDELLIMPTGVAALRSKAKWEGSTISLDASASLGPYVDWLSGIVYERAEGSAGFRWDELADHWSLLGRARGAVAVDGGAQAGTALAAAEVSVAYAFRKDFSVQGGSRLVWQRLPASVGLPYFEWTTFISLILTERGSL